jgi:hypothetical protein
LVSFLVSLFPPLAGVVVFLRNDHAIGPIESENEPCGARLHNNFLAQSKFALGEAKKARVRRLRAGNETEFPVQTFRFSIRSPTPIKSFLRRQDTVTKIGSKSDVG